MRRRCASENRFQAWHLGKAGRKLLVVSRCYPALFLLASLSLSGQEPDTKTARLEGVVLDAVTGQPVKKAAVLLRTGAATSEGLAAVTGATGHFEFAGLPPGNWSAEVHRDGYVTLGSFEEAGAKATRWTLEPGAVIKDVKLRLSPAGVITGRVLDADSEPVANANVRLSAVGGKKDLRQGQFAQTNDLGEYRVFNVPPGKYLVSATYEPEWRLGLMKPVMPETSGKQAPREDYVTTYYPGAVDASQAAVVTVSAGALVSSIEIRRSRGGVVRVRGRVAGASGPLAVMMLMRFEGRPPAVAGSQSGLARPDGSFEFDNVRPGRYLLECDAAFESPTDRLRGRQWIDVGSTDVEGIQIAVSRPMKIEGRVRAQGDNRLPAGLHAMLVPREENPSHEAGGFAALRPDGMFSFDSVYEGLYDLVLVKLPVEPDDFYVKAVRFGDDEALNAGLEVRGGGSGKLDVLLSDDGGTITCRVTSENGEPAPHVRVTAVPAGTRRHAMALHGQAESGDHGECKMQGMAPGAYFVFASEGRQTPVIHDDEEWQRIEKFAAKVEVGARATAAVELKLMPSNATEE